MLIVLAGPSGSGKSTLAARLCVGTGLLKRLPSYTTRPPRDSDPPGEYIYTGERQFDEMCAQRRFLWTVRPFGSKHKYGTFSESVDVALEYGLWITLLTGDAIPILHGYHLGRRKGLVRYFYLELHEETELRRRLSLDPSRTDFEARLASAHSENLRAHESPVPLHMVDASLPQEEVYRTVASELNLPH